MCAFTHDRYRQAAFNLGELLCAEEIQGMALKIVDVLLSETNPDFFQVAEHVLKCVPLLLTQKNAKYQRILRQAGDLSLSQGAHEVIFGVASCALGWSSSADPVFRLARRFRWLFAISRLVRRSWGTHGEMT